MWLLQGVGAMEVLLLLVASLLLSLFRASRRWMVGIVPCLLIAALVPPQDPFTMLLIAIPLVGAFVAGVHLAPGFAPLRRDSLSLSPRARGSRGISLRRSLLALGLGLGPATRRMA